MTDNTHLSVKATEDRVIPYASPVVVTNIQSEDEDELSLGQAWSIIKHRALLIGAIAVGVTAAVAAWTYHRTPIYEGKFQLLVGEPISLNNQSKSTVLEGLSPGKIDYDTQIEVLKSNSILDPIIENLKQQYPDVEYQKLVGSKQAPLQIEQLKETQILQVLFKDEDPQKIQFVLDNLAQAYLRYSLDERKMEINQGLEFVTTQLPQLRARVNQHQATLQRFRQEYNLVDPTQKAQELTQQLYSLENEFFNTQVQLSETQSLYDTLQQQIGLNVDNAISASYLSEAPRYQGLLNEFQAIEVELAKESARFSENNPIIQTLKEKRERLLPLLQAEAQNALGDRFSNQVSESPALASPSALRLNLNQQYVQAANQLEIYKLRYESLASEIKKIKTQLQQLPALSRKYTELQRELRVATESLDRLLEAEQKLQIDGAQQSLPWQLISKPNVGEEAVYPRPLRNIMLGLLGGSVLGVAAAFLAERLDPVFHSLEDIKEKTQIPLLGMIPWQKEVKSLGRVLETTLPRLQIGSHNLERVNTEEDIQNDYRVSGFLEAFRSLNTNIWLLGSDNGLQCLTVSSASPEDGKSTVAVNLAQAAAAMGQRVLLIDADLRRPQVHRLLDIPNEQGLSNVLATGLDLDEVIQPVPQWDNLFVLTAGNLPPDPIRLLASARMRQLKSQLQQEETFDLVIYDTPPLANFADARILGSLTNGIIMVVRINKTDRSAIKHTLDDLKMANVPLLGIVANGIQRSGLGGYSDYYYYYSRR